MAENCVFMAENCDFMAENGDFMAENGDFMAENGDFMAVDGWQIGFHALFTTFHQANGGAPNICKCSGPPMPQDAKPTVGYPIFTLGLPIPSANATALAHRSVQPRRKFGDLQALQRDAAIRVEGVGGLGVIRGLCQEDDRYVNGWVSGKFYRKLRKPCILPSNMAVSRCPFGKHRGAGLVYHLSSPVIEGVNTPLWKNQPTNGKRISMVASHVRFLEDGHRQALSWGVWQSDTTCHGKMALFSVG